MLKDIYYVIAKSTRPIEEIPYTGYSYLEVTGRDQGQFYTNIEKALEDLEKLEKFNPVGFELYEIRRIKVAKVGV